MSALSSQPLDLPNPIQTESNGSTKYSGESMLSCATSFEDPDSQANVLSSATLRRGHDLERHRPSKRDLPIHYYAEKDTYAVTVEGKSYFWVEKDDPSNWMLQCSGRQPVELSSPKSYRVSPALRRAVGRKAFDYGFRVTGSYKSYPLNRVARSLIGALKLAADPKLTVTDIEQVVISLLEIISRRNPQAARETAGLRPQERPRGFDQRSRRTQSHSEPVNSKVDSLPSDAGQLHEEPSFPQFDDSFFMLNHQ